MSRRSYIVSRMLKIKNVFIGLFVVKFNSVNPVLQKIEQEDPGAEVGIIPVGNFRKDLIVSFFRLICTCRVLKPLSSSPE
jgi:hypothetical protein